MLIDKLKDWQYYYKKLPLYMRNSYGIQDHFKMIFDFMINLEDIEKNVCEAFDILQDNYIDIIAKYDSIDGYDFEVLDILGAIYGVNRSLNVTYENTVHSIVNKALYLTNKEFYMLIKARIIQNNYDGTYEQARNYYDSIGLPIYMFSSSNPAECYLYLGSNENTSDNLRSLFLANLLTLKSVGITYIRHEIDMKKMGIWADATDTPNSNNSWGISVWG